MARTGLPGYSRLALAAAVRRSRVERVALGGEDDVALGEPADLVRPNVNTDFPPRDVQVGVMLLLFSDASQRATVEEESGLIMLAQQVSATYNSTDGRLHLENLQPPVGDTISASVKKTDVAHSNYYFVPTDIVLLISPQGQITQQVGPVTADTLVALEKPLRFLRVAISSRSSCQPMLVAPPPM